MAHPLAAAINQYVAKLREWPGDRESYRRVESLCVQTGDWHRLAEVCEVVGDGVADDEERLTAYVRAGNLHESKLADDVSATRCFIKAVGLSPGHPEALGGWVRLLGKQGQWSTAISGITAAVAAVGDPRRRAELLVDVARIRAQMTDDVPGAVADLRRAITEDPSLPRFGDAAEGILGAKGAWAEVAQLWRAFADTTSDPVVRAGALVACANVYKEKLGLFGEAAAALEASVLGASPGSRTLQEAADLYRKAARWPDVLRLLERERAVTTEKARLVVLLTQMAEVQSGPMGDPSGAADAWLALLKLQPDDAAAAEQLSAQLTRAGRWEDLARVGERTLEREKDPEKFRALALATAKLYEERLGLPDRACKLYEELSKRDAADVEVIEALTRVYEARGRWADLAATCERAASLLGEVAGKSYLHHAASLHEFRLGRPDRAIAIYRQLLAEDAGDEFASSALVRLFREQDDPGSLAEALEAFARISSDPAARREARAERAQLLLEDLEDPFASVAAWDAALAEDGKWVQGIQGLQAALRKSVAFAKAAKEGNEHPEPAKLQARLLDTIDRELALATDPRRRADLEREAGSVLLVRGENEEARERYERARREDPDDVESIEALASLYREPKKPRDEVGCWRLLARMRKSARERAEACFVLGSLLKQAEDEGTLFKVADEEELEQDEPWARAWRRALAEDPAHRGALEALAEHHEGKKDWDGAVELLMQQTRVTHEAAGKAALLTRTGDHLRLRIGDEVTAMEKYAQAITLSPRHLPAARPLADGLFRSRRWAEAEPLYKRFGADLALEPTAKGAAEAFWRAGAAYRELNREEDAIFQWRKAVEADGTYLPALDDLAGLLKKRAEWRPAREVYAKVLFLATSQGNGAKQAETHRALAVIAEALGEGDEAIERYKKVTQVEPGDVDALSSLARLYVESGRWREALDVYEQLLPYTGDPAQAAKIYVKRGEILAERLEDPAKAVDAYAAALQATHSVEVRYRLADALARCGRWMEAAGERAKLADEEEDLQARISHLAYLGEVRRDRLRDDAGSREAFERVLALDPVNRPALVALAALYEKARLWEPLVRVLRTSAEQLDPRRTAAASDLRTRIAALLSEKLSDTVEAVGELRLALAASPEHAEALNRMAALAPTDPAFDREALEAHHKLAGRDPLRVESLKVLGEIYARIGRGERARLISDLLTLLKTPHKPLTFIAEAVRKKLPPIPSFALAPEDVSTRIPHPSEKSPILQVMRLLETAQDRLYPPNLKEKGAESADRVDASRQAADPGSLPAIAAAYARALGIGKLTIYRARAASVEVSVESERPWALLLGPKTLADSPREAAHPVARALWFLANGIPLLAKLKPDVYERLVLAAIAAFLGTKESEKLAEKAAAKKDDLQLVRSAMSRRKANELKEVAPAALAILGEDPRGVVRQWRRAASMSADRAALILTGDVAGSVRRALGGGVPAEIAARDPARVTEVLRGSTEAFELIRFAVGDDFYVLREALGFTGSPQ